MPIYIKESVYTPEEMILLAGTGITSTVLETYAADILQSHIIEQRDTMVLTGTPTVRYIVGQK